MEALKAQEIAEYSKNHPADAIVLLMDPEGKLDQYKEIIQVLESNRIKVFKVLDPENWNKLCYTENSDGSCHELFEVLNGGLVVDHKDDPNTTRATDYLERLHNGRFTLFNGNRVNPDEFSTVHTPELTSGAVQEAVDRILGSVIIINLEEPVKANILACEWREEGSKAPEGSDLKIRKIKVHGLPVSSDITCEVEGWDRPLKLDTHIENGEITPWKYSFINYRFVGEHTRIPQANIHRIKEFLDKLFSAISTSPEFQKVIERLNS